MAYCQDDRVCGGRMGKFEYQRLDTIPLPRQVKMDAFRAYQAWKHANGKDWAVNRIKSLRDCIAKSYSEGKLCYKPDWFATTRSGNLKGWPGSLYKNAMHSSSGLKAVLFLLNMYTLDAHDPKEVHLKEMWQSTSGQRAVKHLGKVNRRIYPALDRLHKLHSLYCREPVPIFQTLPRNGQVARVPWDLEWAVKNDCYSKHSNLINLAIGYAPDTSSEFVTYPDGSKLENPFFSYRNHDLDHDMMLTALEQGCYGFIPKLTYIDGSNEFNIVGRVDVHLQAGCKDRYYFAPNLVYQRALDPLKEELCRISKSMPWDCSYEQRRADLCIRKALKEGKMVYSVDLHAATDNFPWELQKHVLLGLTTQKRRGKHWNYASAMVSLFIDLVEQGSFIFEVREGCTCVPPFSKGQPLGYGPSFPLFNISHGLSLFILNNMKWDGQFFVCGDDVVIIDNEELYLKYRQMLERFEVEVSEKKTFVSSSLAQFTGVTYTSDRQFWVPKWHRRTSESVLDIVSYWYPALIDKCKDSDWIKAILGLPEPYGTGFNPKGLPLETRCPSNVWSEIISRRLDSLRKANRRDTTINTTKLSIALRDSVDLARPRKYNPKRKAWELPVLQGAFPDISDEALWALLCALESGERLEVSFNPSRIEETILDSSVDRFYTPADLHYYANPGYRFSNPSLNRKGIEVLDGTDVYGFPMRKRRYESPYTLGSLRTWKTLIRTAGIDDPNILLTKASS